MMPYAGFKALRLLDVDEPFAADQLGRYGYLRNDASPSNSEGLPVDFVNRWRDRAGANRHDLRRVPPGSWNTTRPA